MPRIRTIKPGFWSDEDLSDLPEPTHMLAAQLLNYADDQGLFNANPKLIKAECSPLREPSVSIHESLKLLSGVRYLDLGTGTDGKRYGRIRTFLKHQNINRPSKSKINEIEILWEDCVKAHPQFSETSSLEEGKEREEEREGRSESEEGCGEGITSDSTIASQPCLDDDDDPGFLENPNPTLQTPNFVLVSDVEEKPTPESPAPEPARKTTAPRGSRLPQGWSPGEDEIEFCRGELGWPDARIRETGETFRDYWIARPGQGGVKLDWLATWRNWCRSDQKRNGNGESNGRGPVNGGNGNGRQQKRPFRNGFAELIAERFGGATDADGLGGSPILDHSPDD